MNIKSLLFGSTAALFTISDARAANSIVLAESKPVEYVRVCDAYGTGYFYIPGTETCMRISGNVHSDIKGGNNVGTRQAGNRNRNTYAWGSQAVLRSHTASEIELGTVLTFVELRSQWDSSAEDSTAADLRFAFIELGGLHIGLDESIFSHWTGYFGNVMNDDNLNPMAYTRTNVISYTFNAGNGFSAILGLEQGNSDGSDGGFRFDSEGKLVQRKLSQKIDAYVPNLITGVKYIQGWGGLSAVTAYDAYYSEWAGKMRLDVNLTNRFSLWAMGGYKSMKDYYNMDLTYGDGGVDKISPDLTYFGIYRVANSIYGDWGGAWAVWGGSSYKFTPQTSLNFQVAYEEARTFASSVNVEHELIPGLTITPEVVYISWNDKHSGSYKDRLGTVHAGTSLKGKDALQGMLRLKHSF
ncbi:MAG: porin [Candidatus Tokpelaia sp. JSC189]|nr:MAG: porin [Candidatus Tokpelaia sp. JSC189]